MISISIEGIEDLLNLIQSLESRTITDNILDIIEDELWIFAQIIHSDNTIPDEYRNALGTKVIRELDTVVLMAVPSEERLKYIKFGTRLEWAAYKCPKRKYYGGELSPEYSGPSYLKEKWNSYKNTFINNIKSRIIEMIRGR